ncbi:uncharacterized protein LOC101862048 [Aplysia californica]|uniref:Uncharacterized protein LOC101862048 n=1 Tax=Aplysia californica TaxID=6500 RepID=A0ABM1A3N2_APLCA|nr:uncharacterized protein LOC101862048 [Aplysia californica]
MCASLSSLGTVVDDGGGNPWCTAGQFMSAVKGSPINDIELTGVKNHEMELVNPVLRAVQNVRAILKSHKTLDVDEKGQGCDSETWPKSFGADQRRRQRSKLNIARSDVNLYEVCYDGHKGYTSKAFKLLCSGTDTLNDSQTLQPSGAGRGCHMAENDVKRAFPRVYDRMTGQESKQRIGAREQIAVGDRFFKRNFVTGSSSEQRFNRSPAPGWFWEVVALGTSQEVSIKMDKDMGYEKGLSVDNQADVKGGTAYTGRLGTTNGYPSHVKDRAAGRFVRGATRKAPCAGAGYDERLCFQSLERRLRAPKKGVEKPKYSVVRMCSDCNQFTPVSEEVVSELAGKQSEHEKTAQRNDGNCTRALRGGNVVADSVEQTIKANHVAVDNTLDQKNVSFCVTHGERTESQEGHRVTADVSKTPAENVNFSDAGIKKRGSRELTGENYVLGEAPADVIRAPQDSSPPSPYTPAPVALGVCHRDSSAPRVSGGNADTKDREGTDPQSCTEEESCSRKPCGKRWISLGTPVKKKDWNNTEMSAYSHIHVPKTMGGKKSHAAHEKSRSSQCNGEEVKTGGQEPHEMNYHLNPLQLLPNRAPGKRLGSKPLGQAVMYFSCDDKAAQRSVAVHQMPRSKVNTMPRSRRFQGRGSRAIHHTREQAKCEETGRDVGVSQTETNVNVGRTSEEFFTRFPSHHQLSSSSNLQAAIAASRKAQLKSRDRKTPIVSKSSSGRSRPIAGGDAFVKYRDVMSRVRRQAFFAWEERQAAAHPGTVVCEPHVSRDPGKTDQHTGRQTCECDSCTQTARWVSSLGHSCFRPGLHDVPCA